MSEYREQTRAEWLHGLVDEQENEIERLRGELADREKRIHKQCKRIEALEELAVLSGWQSLDGDLDDKHIITTAQIDAAWMMANSCPGDWRGLILEILKKAFGIERCESPKHLPLLDNEPCPDCGGHGWVEK